ncbi:MAG: hypothetical protein LKK19_06640 [Bacteroidales bacterium]|jgi:trigger factor|nr:hypothetical protein [Bacteroidales bacterium]MCI2122362.1 hypothetical protein [Bacteroidales bacterium]MCI2145674.1 hypothetical protein [Bacteroidales bacterium]
MNIATKQTDDLNRTVTIEIENADYQEMKVKRLKEFRRKAEIKGFRKGNAPMGLIEHLRGPEALADSINEVVSSALEKYIKDNELNLLGEPIPSEEEDKNDWNNPDKFSFSFDMGLAPKIDFDVTKDDSIPYYDIKTDDKAVADYRESMLRRFGKLEDADVSGEESFMTLNMEQGDRKLEDVYITLPRIADKGQRAVFIGKKKGDSFDVDMTSTFPDETERANVLRVKKEELASIDPVWKASVVQIKIFVKAEPTQEIFDQLFEKGTVTCEEEFAAKIRERLASEYSHESDFRFITDVRSYYIGKTELPLPENFLKRWIYNANKEKYSKEDIDKEFDGFAKDFRWQMISGYLMKKYQLKADKEDMLKQAKMYAAYQYAMYGISDVPDDQLTAFAQNILSDKDQAQRILEKVEEEAVAGYVKGVVTLDRKSVTLDEFRRLK